MLARQKCFLLAHRDPFDGAHINVTNAGAGIRDWQFPGFLSSHSKELAKSVCPSNLRTAAVRAGHQHAQSSGGSRETEIIKSQMD